MKERAEDALEVDEFVIRLFMIVGVCIWTAAAAMAYFSGDFEVFYGYSLVALFTAGVLAVGWFYERIAEAALLVAAGALIAWGISAGMGDGHLADDGCDADRADDSGSGRCLPLRSARKG